MTETTERSRVKLLDFKWEIMEGLKTKYPKTISEIQEELSLKLRGCLVRFKIKDGNEERPQRYSNIIMTVKEVIVHKKGYGMTLVSEGTGDPYTPYATFGIEIINVYKKSVHK